MITDKAIFKSEAIKYMHRYALQNDQFLIEQVRNWAYSEGLEEPLEARWWGAVTNSAKASGYIERAGHAPTSEAGHGRYMTLWNSKISR